MTATQTTEIISRLPKMISPHLSHKDDRLTCSFKRSKHYMQYSPAIAYNTDHQPLTCSNPPAGTEVNARYLTTLWDSEAAPHQLEEKEQAAHGILGLPAGASVNQG